MALAIGSVVSANGAGGLASGQPFFNDTASFATISAGAAIAAYLFLGFDAVTTLAEETINPRRTVPRAIMLVALIGGHRAWRKRHRRRFSTFTFRRAADRWLGETS